MKATISSYRGSGQTQKNNQAVLLPEGVSKKEDAKKLIGKKVFWTSPKGVKLQGKITNFHGTKGALRVRFDRGMPGQALGSLVEIV